MNEGLSYLQKTKKRNEKLAKDCRKKYMKNRMELEKCTLQQPKNIVKKGLFAKRIYERSSFATQCSRTFNDIPGDNFPH